MLQMKKPLPENALYPGGFLRAPERQGHTVSS
jgi:hypothetical protein